MSDEREQRNDSNVPPAAEEREAEYTQDFIEKLIWRGNNTCIEGIPSKDRRDGPIVKQPNKEELFIRYKNECSVIGRCLYSIATTPELLSKADNLSKIVNEALEIARSFLWYNAQLHDFSKKFHELAPKWESEIVGFFSRVNQDSETPQPPQVEAIPPEHQTLPMPKTELANLYGGNMTQEKIASMISAGALNVIKLSRQSFIFDRRDLPKHVIDKLAKIE